MKDRDKGSAKGSLISNFDNRLTSLTVLKTDAAVLDDLDDLPAFPTEIENGGAYGFRTVNRPSADVDPEVQGIEREPVILDYLEEKEEKTTVFDTTDGTKEEPVSKIVSITAYVIGNYIVLESSSDIPTSKIVSVLQNSADADVSLLQFPPEFCSWLNYSGREGKELFEHLEIQRLRQVSYRGGESIEERVKVEGNPDASESIVAEITDSDLVSLRADFEVYGYSVMSQIRSPGRLTVSVQESRAGLNSSQRLLIALLFVRELCNYFLVWEKDQTSPPDSFTTESLTESISISRSDQRAQKHTSGDELSVRTDSEFWKKSPGELVEEGESELIEFKDPRCGDEKVVKELVALANKRGGALLLGVSDDSEIVGLDNPGEREEAIQNRLDTTVRPRIACEVEFERIDGDDLLIFKVGQFLELPHSVGNIFYTRRGTTKRKLTPYELSYLMPEREENARY